MDFPITELMDEQACYDRLVGWLHPDGLACPRCHGADTSYVHRRDRDPILDYRCRACRCVFNAFTGTALQGTKRRPVALLLILRGFAQGVSTARDARAGGASGDRADDGREYGRVAGVQRAAGDEPPPIGGVPRRGRVGPR